MAKNGRQLFYKELLYQKLDSVPFNYTPKTDERFIENQYGQLGIFDSSNVMNMSFETSVKALGEDEETLKENIMPEKL